MMDSFSFRINDMELRSCDSRLTNTKPYTTAEIVVWNDNHCYTIAYWVKDNEGYDLKFVSDRPFESFHLWGDFGKLAKQGQELVNMWFNEV